MASPPPLPTLPGPDAPVGEPDFLPYVWKAGKKLVRCGPEPSDPSKPLDPKTPYVSAMVDHPLAGAPGHPAVGSAGHPSARFSPFKRGKTGRGNWVPTLYAASTALGALSETVFHDVPVEGDPKSVEYSHMQNRFLIDLVCDVDLHLADLTMPKGLRRISRSHAKMIESGPDQYDKTVKWAHAAYQDRRNFDGMVWTSRQDHTARAVVLFGGRGIWEKHIRPLEHRPGAAKSPLTGPGTLDWILGLAEDAGITIRGLPFMPS